MRNMNGLNAILISMRPKQWTKNLVLFAGVVFSKNFTSPSSLKESFYGFVIFCALSGTIYILNDIFDREKDKSHPVKRLRPIASGTLSVAAASIVSAVVAAVSLAVSWFFGLEFFIIAVAFVVINIAYSLFIKNIVILDVITISFSFLLRAVAGVAVLRSIIPDVELSPWLLICTLFLSLFLAICKRRHEMLFLENASSHRKSLGDYSVHLLDQLVGLSATTSLLSYSIYTVWPKTVEKFHTANLVYTIPFVVFGIMRYLYLVYNRNKGEDPSNVLIMEKSILIDVFLWFVVTVLILIF
ncbi:MAG: decaprenyl-phosphate phosphoribosyltransferase [Candidatus Latescibacteria bacterium 4484_7]|nr:MAG: decaprenyl-phosphate phosphoribosyltransferase [Candidatus Latescibacteria bacterium 4484_7]